VSSIDSIRILPPKPPQAGAMDVTVGRVLAFDRKSRTLVLKDPDEDGISAIESIQILR